MMKLISKNSERLKHRDFTYFPSVEILWKGTVSTDIRANRSKLCGNSVFSQNFHTRKLGESTLFYAVGKQLKVANYFHKERFIVDV